MFRIITLTTYFKVIIIRNEVRIIATVVKVQDSRGRHASISDSSEIPFRKQEMRSYSRYVFSDRALNQPSCFILTFPHSRRRDNFKFFTRGKLFLKLNIHLFLQLSKIFRLLYVPEDVLDKCVQNVQTMNLITLCDRKIKTN